GSASVIWLCDVQTHAVEKIPQPEGRSNDVDAQWIGNTGYFRSDRDGEFSVYAYDAVAKKVRRLTTHEYFPVLSMNAGAGKLIYEQAGYLHVLEPTDNGNGRQRVNGD